MDTDDLSKEAYLGTLCEVDKDFHDLAIQYGCLADDCEDDDELEELFFGELPDKKELYVVLEKVRENIKKIRLIPFEKRHFDED